MARPAIAAARLLAGTKEPVRAATTANVDLVGGGLLTIDGVALSAGDRVLVKNQSDATENGVYDASAGEWIRASDSRSTRTLNKGMWAFVQSGSVNEGKYFAFETLDPNLGTDAIVVAEVDPGGGGPWQPLDSDLTEISILNTSVFGRSLLTLVDASSLAALLTYATAADVRSSATGGKIVTSDLVEGASALVAMTDAGTIAFDWDAGINRSVTLGGNRTLGNPTNGQPGTWRTVVVTQDGAGGRTLAYGDQYKFEGGEEPALSAAANAVDVLSILCVSATNFFVFSALDMQAV